MIRTKFAVIQQHDDFIQLIKITDDFSDAVTEAYLFMSEDVENHFDEYCRVTPIVRCECDTGWMFDYIQLKNEHHLELRTTMYILKKDMEDEQSRT